MEKEVFLEKLGGDVPWAAVSAKDGTGVEELLDLILLVAEIHEFKADPSLSAEGFVIEAHRDQKRGIAATLIITSGTLHGGSAVCAGDAIAPVRIMEDHLGKSLKEATFSTPISLTGFDALPAVGETFKTYKNKRDAEVAREADRSTRAIQPVAQRIAEESGKFMMPVIIRADTTGSLEAIEQELARIGDEHASIRIVQTGVGTVSETDIKSAIGSSIATTVIGFNVGTERQADTLALQHGVRVETFAIIYKLTERLEELLKESKPKRVVEEVVGKAKIIRLFSSHKGEHVIGGSVIDGYLAKKATVRIIRRTIPIGTAKLINIQAAKQNTDRVEAGTEFGAQLESMYEPAVGDVLECFITVTK